MPKRRRNKNQVNTPSTVGEQLVDVSPISKDTPTVDKPSSSIKSRAYALGSTAAKGAYTAGNFVAKGVYTVGGAAVNVGKKIAGGAFSVARTVVGGVTSSAFGLAKNLLGRVWSIGTTAAIEESVENEDKLLENVEEQIQGFVTKNEQSVDDLIASGRSLVDVFLSTVPSATQNAVRNLAQNKEFVALMQSNTQLLQLLGTPTIEDGVKLLISGANEGALLPQNEIAALQIMLQGLNVDQNIKSQDVVLAREFLGTLVQTLNDLQTGKKQYISFVTEVNGYAKIMHVNFDDLLNNPKIISRIYSILLQQGATKNVSISFTSYAEAAALSAVMGKDTAVSALMQGVNAVLSQESQLALSAGNMDGALAQGSNTVRPIKELSELVNLVIKSATDNLERLSAVFGIPASDLVQGRNQALVDLRARPTQGLTISQIHQLMQKTATIILTKEDVVGAIKQNKGAIGTFARLKDASNSVELANGTEARGSVTIIDSSLQENEQSLLLGNIPSLTPLTDVRELQQTSTPLITMEETPSEEVKAELIEHHSHTENPESIVIEDEPIDTSEASKPKQKDRSEVSKGKLDLSKQKEKYDALLKNLGTVVQELFYKLDKNSKYEQVAFVALDLHDKLACAAEHFFNNPSADSFKAFKKHCHDSIQAAEPVFAEHRGVWQLTHPVIKGILAVISALTIIPGLMVAGFSTHGFYDTFFGTPITNSAIALAETASEIDDIDNETEQSMRTAITL
ncbi:hypothetical protein [Legionella fallonii]|uniref:Uncharacterized protein n=1 Tax=Legionella fallonii LLAP-10 TaxID=1212491 RepID=A0A098G690_9GAMM|nr:hypothetical protein [Legionella fallonii]CEG57484.1 protein of unknown function [Legionella fallonii LLAP-10]